MCESDKTVTGIAIRTVGAGLRVNFEDPSDGSHGWIMERMSLHDPIVIFNVESTVSFVQTAVD